MASTIDLNKLYNYYLNKYGDKKTAAQYTAFQYLSNPTGSVAGLKEPEKYYTLDEYYNYNAPSYSSLINFTGDTNTLDALTKYTANALKPYKGKTLQLADLSRIAQGAQNAGALDDTNYNTQDYYNQLKDIYTEKTAAEKAFEKQKNTHPYAQFGLGDPNLRYTVYTKPTDPTAGSSFAGRDTANKFDPSKYVQYKPAVDYVAKSMQSFGDTLLKKGIKVDKIRIYQEQFRTALEKAVQSKLDSSNLSPFVDQVKALRPIRKP